jgi:hypothetical protein
VKSFSRSQSKIPPFPAEFSPLELGHRRKLIPLGMTLPPRLTFRGMVFWTIVDRLTSLREARKSPDGKARIAKLLEDRKRQRAEIDANKETKNDI